jgi:hypothetical protein
MDLTRRSAFTAPLFLGSGMLGAVAAAATAGPAVAQGMPDTAAILARFSPDEPGFNPANPYHNAEVFSRMQLGNDGKTNYGWFSGRVFAVIGDDQTIFPLFDLEGFGANRHIRQPDGTYQHLHREVGYYKDLRSGEIIERWANPMIGGEVVDVFHINNDPVNAIIGPVVKSNLGEGQVNATFPFIMPWTSIGDHLMSSFDVNTGWKNVLDPKVWPRESNGREMVRVSEYLQFYTSKKAVENWRAVERIPNHGSWQRNGTWLPWMLMGSGPGHLFYRCHTKALAGIDELPRHIRAYTEKNFPVYMEAPATWQTPNVTSFEVYKRDRKPVPIKS